MFARVKGTGKYRYLQLVSSLINRVSHLAAFARICSAGFVHTKGLAPSFHFARKAFIAPIRWFKRASSVLGSANKENAKALALTKLDPPVLTRSDPLG